MNDREKKFAYEVLSAVFFIFLVWALWFKNGA